jgi:hypothetical protein
MGDIAPVWPNHPPIKVIITGGEQGDPVGHLASYTNLILQNKALYNQAVTIGDNNHYGNTYLERAKNICYSGHNKQYWRDGIYSGRNNAC